MTVVIAHGTDPAPAERYAAADLRRYLYHLTGEIAVVTHGNSAVDGPVFWLGTRDGHGRLAEFVASGLLTAPAAAESYVVRTVGGRGVAVLGADPQGVLYGTRAPGIAAGSPRGRRRAPELGARAR